MVSRAFYLGVLGLLGAERLFELWLSRKNARRALGEGAVEVGVVHSRVMVAVHALFFAGAAGEPFLVHRRVPEALALGALVLAVAAQGLRYWAILTLGPRWNTRVIVLAGAEVITFGPYRFLRHPNYVAVAVELLAVPLIGGAYATAVAASVANALLMAVRIPAEERALGAAYAQAFARTPRFLPGGGNGG